MARNTKITVQDRALVKKRLVMGLSLNEAIAGTNIKSPNTARRIGLEEMHDIGKKRKKYVKLIESFGASEFDRAETMGKMVSAKKPHGPKSEEFPDWRSRSEAVKYIDTLAGFYEEKGPDIKASVHVDNRKLYVVLPSERQGKSPGQPGRDLLEATSGKTNGSPDKN